MLRHLDQMDAAAKAEGVNLPAIKSDRRAPAAREFLDALGTENTSLLRLGDWYDTVTMFPGRVLDQTDVGSKTVNARTQHRLEAFRQATFEGRVDEAFQA